MARVWRVGSRWSENGSWESLYKVFRRNGVVFVGSSSASQMKYIKEGDYIAVADGLTIVAVAKALSEANDLQSMIDSGRLKIRKEDFFQADDDYAGWCYGVNVKFVDLDKNSLFPCWPCKAFCEIKDRDMQKRVISLYDSGLDKKFDINAKTCRIYNPHCEDGKDSIINPKVSYVIPIYQREYSWKRSQIESFVRDIFIGFWGTEDDGTLVLDPLFIGTMQLSEKNIDNECDVIDGQQRLSTMLCIIKYLQLKYPDNPEIQRVSIGWLSTMVNNGKEQEYLDALISLDSIESIQAIADSCTNAYLRNISIISDVFNEYIIDEEGDPNVFFLSNLSQFINYFLSSIYFVVIETKAGLSKVLQIFNTINTAGLDLGTTDLFKIRLYEYLRDQGAPEQTFDKISALYKKIKDINFEWRKTHAGDVVSLNSMLDIYKNYLIAKFNLRSTLFSMATDTFFDYLFDVLLKVRDHKDKGFSNLNNLILSIEDIDRIIDTIHFWNSSDFNNVDEWLCYKLTEWTRYSKHNSIAYLILLREDCGRKTDVEKLKMVYSFLYYYGRFFFMANINAARIVYDIDAFGYEMYKSVTNDAWEDSIKNVYIKTRKWSISAFEQNLKQNIFQRRLWANSVCCLSACLDEIEDNAQIVPEELDDKFDKQYDIEHIHARNDPEFDFQDDDLLNSIGNLMLLESDINKSISNLPFREKVNRSDGKKCYKNSCYASVKRMKSKCHWDETDAEKRRNEVVQKIISFVTKDLVN